MMSNSSSPFAFSEVCQHALVEVQIAQARLAQLCPAYVAGAVSSYEAVSRAAYLFGYELKTLSQTMNWLMMSTPVHVQYLEECSQVILDRAKEFEQLFASGALIRSHVYFDDVLQSQDLAEELILRVRDDSQTPQPNASTGGQHVQH